MSSSGKCIMGHMRIKLDEGYDDLRWHQYKITLHTLLFQWKINSKYESFKKGDPSMVPIMLKHALHDFHWCETEIINQFNR